MNRWFNQLLVFGGVIIIDQTLKFLALSGNLPGFVGAQTVCNPNIAWSISVTGVSFWLLWIFAIVLLFYLWLTNGKPLLLSLVLAGALSNVIDRLVHGCVVDVIDLGWFPVFNIADAAITVGVGLFVITQLMHSRKIT